MTAGAAVVRVAGESGAGATAVRLPGEAAFPTGAVATRADRAAGAAVVGVIAVVSLDLIPEALVDWPTLAIALAAFVLIAFLKCDVALVAIGAMLGGIIYSSTRGSV